MKKNNIIILLSLLVSAAFAQPLQQSLYQQLPQSKYQTPGVFPEGKFFIGIPALSNLNFGLSSSGFAFTDIIDGSGAITKLTITDMVNGLDEKNFLGLEQRMDILHFGFRVAKKNFITLNVSQKTTADFSFNKNFLGFIALGNGAPDVIGKSMSLDGTSYNITSYAEAALGYSRIITDKLSAGVRVRFLNGIMNASGNFDGISIHTDADDLAITANSSFSVYNYGLTELMHDTVADKNEIPNFSNLSVAFDLGASYKVTDKIMAYLSITDLGNLKWKNGRKKFNDGASFTYEGLPLDKMTQDSAFMENFMDSISDIFKLQESREDYTTALPTTFLLGGNYKLNRFFEVDALMRGRIFGGKFYPSFMLGGGARLGKILQAKVSYSIANKTYTNLGVGLVANLGGLQIYAVTDNIGAFTAVDYAKNMNIAFGINVVIGGKGYEDDDDKDKKKDKKDDKK